ncbi:hypothetical protein P7C70_g3987, partial [Phenoliferia sp. Uapishka_3]
MSKHAPFEEVEATRSPFDKEAPWEVTKTVDPTWPIGGGLNDIPWPKASEGKWLEVDPLQRPKTDVYRMMISGVNPRPVAFISTVNEAGVTNLAPFSFFNLASANPPTVMISITHDKPPILKETCQNILDTKQFVVNMISEVSRSFLIQQDFADEYPKAFIEAANACAIDSPADVSEFDITGLTATPSKIVKPPRVGESAFSMECTLMHHYDIYSDAGVLSSTVILGRVRLFHVREDLVDSETLKVDTDKMMNVSRLGGISYGRTRSAYEIQRPVWKVEEGTKEMKAALGKAELKGRKVELLDGNFGEFRLGRHPLNSISFSEADATALASVPPPFIRRAPGRIRYAMPIVGTTSAHKLDLSNIIYFPDAAHSPVLPPDPGETWRCLYDVGTSHESPNLYFSSDKPRTQILDNSSALRPLFPIRDFNGSVPHFAAWYTSRPGPDALEKKCVKGRTLVVTNGKLERFMEGFVGFRIEDKEMIEIRLTCSLNSRHWYLATKDTTQYATISSLQAGRLALKLEREREGQKVRRLNLSIAEPGGVKKLAMEAYAILLKACVNLEALELSFGLKYDRANHDLDDYRRIREPDLWEIFSGLEESLGLLGQLRELTITSNEKILDGIDLIDVPRSLKNLDALDLSGSEIAEPDAPSSTKPPLQLPLRTLMVSQLETRYSWLKFADIFPFAGKTLQRIRVGTSYGDLDPFFESVAPFADQILEFECQVCSFSSDVFDLKNYLCLKRLMTKMKNLESLEINLSGWEHEELDGFVDPSEPEETRKVDTAIIETLKTLKELKHLILRVNEEPSTSELEECEGGDAANIRAYYSEPFSANH